MRKSADAADAAEQLMDDLSSRAARHKREEQVAYATVTQLSAVQASVAGVSAQLSSMRGDIGRVEGQVTKLRETINGDVEGIERVPGLVDVVKDVRADARRSQRSSRMLLASVLGALLANFALQLLHDLGIFH